MDMIKPLTILKMLGEGLVLMGLFLALCAWTIIGAAMLGVL